MTTLALYLCWVNKAGKNNTMAKKKSVNDSKVIMTEMVLPNDTNTLDNLMGGRLMHWMDICAAICAQKHSNRTVVTASDDNISFGKAIQLGNVVTLESHVTRAFNSSMEIYIKVKSERIPFGKSEISNQAFFTFVAVDQAGHPIEIPEVIPETEHEKELYAGALRRRQLRLVLAKRMKVSDAKELKNYLDNA